MSSPGRSTGLVAHRRSTSSGTNRSTNSNSSGNSLRQLLPLLCLLLLLLLIPTGNLAAACWLTVGWPAGNSKDGLLAAMRWGQRQRGAAQRPPASSSRRVTHDHPGRPATNDGQPGRRRRSKAQSKNENKWPSRPRHPNSTTHTSTRMCLCVCA